MFIRHMTRSVGLVFVLSLGLVACSMLAGRTLTERPPDSRILQMLNEDSDKTLAVKGFDRQWVASLDKRGRPITYRRDNSADFDYIGMPIGGLCSGQLYLGGDGKLWYWDIFNTKTMRDVRGVQAYAHPYKRSEPDRRAYYTLDQGFAVRIEQEGRTVQRRLDRNGFENITFRGQYPIGYVTYDDQDFPLRVELEAFSPFIPLDLDDSTYPATVMAYTLTNTSGRAVRGTLVGWLENAVCIDSAAQLPGRWRNRITQVGRWPMLTCTAEKLPADQQSRSDRPDIVFEDFESGLDKWTVQGRAFATSPRPNYHHQPMRGMQGKGLADSYANGGDKSVGRAACDKATGKLISRPFTIQRKAIRLLVGGGRDIQRTCVRLVVDGKVVRSVAADNSETLVGRIIRVPELEGKQAHLEIVDEHTGPWGHVMVDQIVFTDQMYDPNMQLTEQPDYGSMALAVLAPGSAVRGTGALAGVEGPLDGRPAAAGFEQDRPVGAIGQDFSLAPGQSATIRFIVSWYFPNLRNVPVRTAKGRQYGRRFDSAAQVAAHIADRYDQLAGQTRLWHRTWYDSTLPWWFLDRTFLNTSILATNTCYLLSDGRFFGWEGVYHGNGTCTHVWGYVQAPGRLFPVLEQRLREMVDYKPGIGFVPETGLIAYRSGFRFNDAVDGQSGCILRTYLVHQMQTDNAFLERVYPAMRKAMDYLTNTYDADHDGILTGGQHNTLDAKWYGKITWLSLHYTAALRAAAAMADDMGRPDDAERWRRLADRGRAYIENHLFNGEYFFHEADPDHPDSPGVYNGLEYSQLLGQSWAYQVGLGRILDPVKVATHLRSLWKYNLTTDVGPFRKKYTNGRWFAMPGEGGIIACTWPYGGDEALLKGNRHFAGYLNECQPGYEWAATSLYMWHGMPYHALAHTRLMHQRYLGHKRNPWNEVEWGSHYSRSMASYGVFTAACGFEYHGPKGYIAFSPRIRPHDFKAAFTSAAGWGSFVQKRKVGRQIETLDVRYGSLRLKRLAFDLAEGHQARHVAVRLADQDLPADFAQSGRRLVVTLSRPVVVPAGRQLEVDIR